MVLCYLQLLNQINQQFVHMLFPSFVTFLAYTVKEHSMLFLSKLSTSLFIHLHYSVQMLRANLGNISFHARSLLSTLRNDCNSFRSITNFLVGAKVYDTNVKCQHHCMNQKAEKYNQKFVFLIKSIKIATRSAILYAKCVNFSKPSTKSIHILPIG